MKMVELGRTGLKVSVAGLGCGGHSRLGMAYGNDEAQATRVVECAIDLGVNFIDTARVYGTESAVGRATKGKRGDVVLSTKSIVSRKGIQLTKTEIVECLDKSLTKLQTDYIDVYNLHGVSAEDYPYCVNEIIPELLKQKEKGKFRFFGITEQFISDPSHEMLKLALPDDYFDVVMVGFNLINPSARDCVFPLTRQNNVATQIMFAVRRALSKPEALAEVVDRLIENGDIEASLVDADAALGFVEGHKEVASIVQAAYRFCRHEPGATIILTGTGSEVHLKQNIDSILAEPLPAEITSRLTEIFGKVDSVSGN
jgi:aryl-alcohol dehydrogenase-like predicted oxidoreductase